MSDEDKTNIKDIIKDVEKKNDNIEDILKAKEWPIEGIYIKLFNEIINELTSLNAIIIDKNPKNNFSKYDKTFLYKAIDLFINLENDKIPKEIIETVLTQGNFCIIMKVFINVNKYNILSQNIIEFNKNIISLLSNTLQNNAELLMDNVLYYKNDILPKFLLSLSKNRKGREFVYELERYILMFIQDSNKYLFYLESMNIIINSLKEQLNKKNFSNIIEEIQGIIYTYKNRINIISRSMINLLIKLFEINEKEITNNEIKDDYYNNMIKNFLKDCYNRIVFTYSSNIIINSGDNNIKNSKDKFQYNVDFMNFLLEFYQELINNRLTNSYTNFLLELFLNLDNIGNGAKRYKWIISHTKFAEIVINSIIKLKETNLLSLYLTKIVFLSIPRDNEYYKPEYDIVFLFDKLKEIFDEKNLEISNNFFHIIVSQIINLININNHIIELIFNKSNIFSQSLSIFNSNEFSNETKYNLLEFLEKIISINNDKTILYKFDYPITNKFDLDDNFDLNEPKSYGLKYKLYLLFFSSDIDNKKFINNIENIINNINFFFENKRIFEIIVFTDLLFKSFLINNNIRYTNEISKEIIDKINDIFIKIPTLIFNKEIIDSNEKLEKLIHKFIELILSFTYLFNQKIIESKKCKLFMKSKIIFTEESLIKIFQNIFEKIDNFDLKNKIITNIFSFVFSNNKVLIDIIKENYKKILQSHFFILILLRALYNINDYISLSKVYEILLESINFSMINIKVILCSDIISFTIVLLINIYVNKDLDNEPSIKECYNNAISLLKILVNFLNQSTLIKYLYNIFNIFYESITDFENKNNNEKSKKILLILFTILKESLGIFYNKQKQNYQYLSLSKNIFPNPFIYNIFYINHLKLEESIFHYNFDIRINSFENIDKFYIVNFINEKTNQSIFIFIDNTKKLLIGENSNNKNQDDILASYEKIDNYLLTDKNFHNISIIVDTINKSIKIWIDYKNIISNNKIVHYKNFTFDTFGLFTGYNPDTIIKNNSKEISPIIDISNILLVNFSNDADNFLINKYKETIKYDYNTDYVIEQLYKEKRERYYKFILAEFCFNLDVIKIIKSKCLKKFNNILDKYLTKNKEKSNKYIAYIDFFNPMKDKGISKLYMFSLGQNIEEYYSSNKLLQFQNMNSLFVQNIFCEKQNIFSSSSNYVFIDFLLGFLFEINKRRELLEEKIEINEEQKLKFLNDEYINEYILNIFQILFNIKNKQILDYYLSDTNNEFISIKVRIFFKNNIYLLNNHSFLNKFIELLFKKNEYFLLFSVHVFTDLKIFSLLNNEIQNTLLINIKSLFEKEKDDLEEKDPIKKQQFLSKIKKEEEINPLLLSNLLDKLINLVLYYPLSNEEIKESNNKKQIDIILTIIKSIISKLKYDQYIKIVNNTKKIIQSFEDKSENYNLENFFENNKNILSKNNSFIDNELINIQHELLNKALNQYGEKPVDQFMYYKVNKSNNGNKIRENSDIKTENELNNDNLVDDFDMDDEQKNNNINKTTKFSYYHFLISYFKIGLEDFYGEIKFEKERKIFYRYIFLNFKEYRQKLGLSKYAWFVSGKASNHNIQNKFILKENYMKVHTRIKKKKNLVNLFSYKYDSDIKKFNEISIQLQKLFIYDKISINYHFINLFKENNNNFIVENCLLINRLFKTLSLFILHNEYILILTNIFIDKDNKLHVNFGKPGKNLWCIKEEDYLNELENYIKNNEDEFNKLFEEKKEENKEEDGHEFGLSKNYKFSVKKIKISEISEIYKTSFLQIPNSIEIVTNKGKNYFLCFNIDRRDNAFYMIIDNISNKYSYDAKNKKLVSNLKKLYKPNSNEIFYMKYCPIYFCNSGIKYQKIIDYKPKLRINKKELYNKVLIEKNIFINDIIANWAKNKISNFDYLMLLNILSERSLNNLSQYIIFPTIICNFNQPFLNHMNSSIYRDLSLPIFACYSGLINDFTELDSKIVDPLDIGDIYHSGIFYSTYAFVSYFLIRQHPYTEIHLEIQNGEFDTADRLFIGQKELSTLDSKHQELIPALFTLPELYLNTNNFLFGNYSKMINGQIKPEPVSDFFLPDWADDDQRKFTLYLKRLLESKRVSQNLHSWIDLIFGYKMLGIESINCYNTYRKACYEPTREEIETAFSEGMLYPLLVEKEEMGYLGKQLFKKQHRKKEVIPEYENKLCDKIQEIKNLKFIKLNIDSDTNEEIVKINDIVITTQNEYIINSLIKKSYYIQGGISSLKSIMNVLNNEYNEQHHKIINIKKLILSFEKGTKFNFLSKKYIILGDHSNLIYLNYNKKIIKIIYSSCNEYALYYLNEIGNISTIIANSKRTKLFIGFDNGNIIIYKIKIYKKDKNFMKELDCIYPFINVSTLNEENNNTINNNIKENIKNKKLETEQPPFIVLQKIISNNSFIRNNIHIPSKIKKLSLDEKNNILIALTITNTIYLISLNDNFKLMNKISYFSDMNYNYKMKNILTFADNGDFIIYSSVSVNLFSINGVPLCELNLLNESYNISKITYCVSSFSGDILLFTGHKDGSVIIWKIKTIKSNEKDIFLHEYDYNYSFDFDKAKIKNYILRRKFEMITKVEQSDDMKIPIKYMQISNDINYMLIINKNKNIFILSGKTDDENNINGKKELDNLDKSGENKKKIICKICKKEYEENQYEQNNLENLENKNEITKKATDSDFEIVDKFILYDKIIEDKGKIENENICINCQMNLENFLYNC